MKKYEEYEENLYLKKYIKKLEKEVYSLKFALENITSGVVITDLDSTITTYNHMASLLEGITQEDAVGHKTQDVYHPVDGTAQSRFIVAMKSRKAVINDYVAYGTLQKNSVRIVQSYYPIIYEGEVIGSCAILNEIEQLESMLHEIIKIKRMALQDSYLISKIESESIIGVSEKMKKSVNEGRKVAKSNVDALVVGETGTGKELMVRLIHEHSDRKEAPFIPINCATIPENLLESILFGTTKGAFTDSQNTTGLFELAKDGTLFLDELNSMSLVCQSKILRVIQEKKIRKIGGEKEINIHCRIIGAINKDPLVCIQNGTLREDLFYRLSIACISIPPLRERIEDLRPLTDYFIQYYNRKYEKCVRGMSKDLFDKFERYTWNGNVRELRNILENMFLLCENDEELSEKHLSDIFRSRLEKAPNNEAHDIKPDNFSLDARLYEMERRLLQEALSKCNGNQLQAAKNLGISPQSMSYKIKKFELMRR